MRKFILSTIMLLLLGSSAGLHAQSSLRNTNWKMYVDQLHDTITLHIKSDSSYATIGDGTVVVRSTVKVTKENLTIRDIDGQYACPGDEGQYTFAIRDNMLELTTVSDNCEGRRNTLNGSKWTKTP